MSDPLKAPERLSGAAREAWDEAIRQHPAPAAIVGAALEAYCVQVARMRDAQARIDREGVLIADSKGLPAPHPALAIERAASADVAKGWAALKKIRR